MYFEGGQPVNVKYRTIAGPKEFYHEAIPQLDHRRSLRTWYSGALVKDLSEAEIAKADAWIDENFVFIVPGEDDDVTLPWSVTTARPSNRCGNPIGKRGRPLSLGDYEPELRESYG